MTTPEDRVHIEAWADCHEGYTVKTRQCIVRCLWCDYISVADTAREAIATYKRQHEQPILDREMADRRTLRAEQTERSNYDR